MKLFISKKYIYIYIKIHTHTTRVFLLQFAEKFKSTRPSIGLTSTVNAEESENEVIYSEIGKFLSPPAVRQTGRGHLLLALLAEALSEIPQNPYLASSDSHTAKTAAGYMNRGFNKKGVMAIY